MNERIKEIRKSMNMSQDAFGKHLGITKASVSRLESGENNPSDQTVILICKEFHISETWLRTGSGEMFLKLETNHLVATAAQLLGKKDPMFETLLETYTRLSPESREILINYLLDFSKTLNGKMNPE